MRFFSFHLMPYPDLPPDYDGPAWITCPNEFFDPRLGGELYNRYIDELVYAEELGFDGVWGFDHFQPMYGDGPGETFEGMTTLAALSGLTSKIRLGLLVTGATYRHPSVLAAQALTIDHASPSTRPPVPSRT